MPMMSQHGPTDDNLCGRFRTLAYQATSKDGDHRCHRGGRAIKTVGDEQSGGLLPPSRVTLGGGRGSPRELYRARRNAIISG